MRKAKIVLCKKCKTGTLTRTNFGEEVVVTCSGCSHKQIIPFNRKTWLIGQARRLTAKYPPANAARSLTKEVYFIKTKKGKELRRCKYTCAICKTPDLKSSQVNLDHIIPVVPTTGWDDWNGFFDRLFCPTSGFQLICLSCHDQKTAKEDAERGKPLKLVKKKTKKRKRS